MRALVFALSMIPLTLSLSGCTEKGTSAENPASGQMNVSVFDNSFGPAEIWVKQGTSVEFVSEGSGTHTATADDGSWNTGDISSSLSASLTLDRVGDFRYHCKYHRAGGMVGIVHVVA